LNLNFWGLGHKRCLRNLCAPRRDPSVLWSSKGKPLSLSSDGVDSCSLKKPLCRHLGSPKTKPKNPTPFWWPPFVACIAVTFLLQGLMNFIRLASNCRRFYGNSAPRHQIFGSWHPPDVWAKLFAQDDRKEIVCTMRCPQTTLIKKVLRLTTWVGSNTSMLACVWVHWGK